MSNYRLETTLVSTFDSNDVEVVVGVDVDVEQRTLEKRLHFPIVSIFI